MRSDEIAILIKIKPFYIKVYFLSHYLEIINVIRSKDQEPDLLYVMKFLASEGIPGLPPGGGISCK